MWPNTKKRIPADAYNALIREIATIIRTITLEESQETDNEIMQERLRILHDKLFGQ